MTASHQPRDKRTPRDRFEHAVACMVREGAAIPSTAYERFGISSSEPDALRAAYTVRTGRRAHGRLLHAVLVAIAAKRAERRPRPFSSVRRGPESRLLRTGCRA